MHLDQSSLIHSPWNSAKGLRESEGSYSQEVKPSSKRRWRSAGLRVCVFGRQQGLGAQIAKD